MVSQRLDRPSASINLHAADHTDIEAALVEALMACAELTLGADVVALQRMVMQERCTFSDIAATFYRTGVQRTQAALADWLRTEQQRNLIALDDAEEAAGMLLGMLVSAPQRAALYGGLPLPSRQQIEQRVRTCAALFLRGCAVKA